MGMTWTKDQQKVIHLRNRNILVSAAAGSGKTAVLVERIIQMITEKEHPTDIDHLLIVTFTNAAAAEMRERIGAAIEKALEEHPADEHLARQLTLLHNAQITTIDSFCLYVIRNHFHEIDLEPNFRIGDEGELKLLKEDVVKNVFERHYEEPEAEFKAFMEGYSSGRSDEAAVEMVLSLYEFSRSYPWPKRWLLSCGKSYGAKTIEELEAAEWMQSLIAEIQFLIKDLICLLEEALALTLESDGPYMYESAVRSDLKKYRSMAEISSFSEFYEACQEITYERLGSSRGYEGSVQKQEQVKRLRETAKETLKKIKKQFFFCEPERMAEQLSKTKDMAGVLVQLAMEFSDAFSEEKRKKNLVDFHDIEHFALEILVDEETGEVKKAAEEFRDAFEEIMIDEYQDSNQVQEAILTAISREDRGQNNYFMVGDVKQSIYRFRLARPELFMEKYGNYSVEDSSRQRIDLNQNFRSRKEVLDFTNDIFYRIMGKDLGNVVYDESAALKPGAKYPDAEMFQTEILLCDSSEELLEDAGYPDRKLLEAKMTAEKIKRLMEEQLVTDKESGELRKARYSDIVILLRSLSGWAEAFSAVLNDAGIPAHAVSATGYFSAVEVQTVLSMLKILDNPRQDIPLAAVLRSPIANITDEELSRLRLFHKEAAFHECILDIQKSLTERMPDNPAEEKLCAFFEKYEKIRKMVPDTPIHELLEMILKETGYGNYAAAMPSGSRRRANIEMLIEKAIAYETTSYKGLFHFVRYIEELQKYDVDFGEADLVGEKEEVVRIMSIHKSKGLEFPIVFVSGLGKNFNKQDVRSRMVLHPDFGLGLDYMDGERRIKMPTIAKKALAKQIELENLGEELRVLYVALTRAKEKLVLTGNQKKIEEALEGHRETVRSMQGGLLPYHSREGAASYLDWILPAVLSYGEKYPIQAVSAEELVKEEVKSQAAGQFEKEQRLSEIRQADETLFTLIETRFEQEYPYKTSILRKNKYSVSELKHRAMRKIFEQEQQETVPLFQEEEIAPCVPHFIHDKNDEEEFGQVSQGALRGTAMHRVMECYDFMSGILPKQQIAEMLEKEQISAEMEQLVKIPVIEKFVNSETGMRMREAQEQGLLYREKPFVMGFTEKELKDYGFEETNQGAEEKLQVKFAEEDLTLIQGIIDVFWLEEDGIVLLDYKTDKVSSEEELITRYKVQMELYAEALNRVFEAQRLRVKEKQIYSFRLGKVLLV